MNRGEILSWLKETDPVRLEALWAEADRVRQEKVGDEVHLRGLVEVSNFCARQCHYCGIRAGQSGLKRYRMTVEEVVRCSDLAVQLDYGTLVLQAGEDPGLQAADVALMVRRIKAETPLAVTLSLGERDKDDLRLWREAGADRYLLRFETSNDALYEKIHPPRPGGWPNRIKVLQFLREIGYELGSGVMIGVPGQTWDDLANDIELFRTLDLDMIGIGPFLPHPRTPMGTDPDACRAPADLQVPNDELTTLKAVALTRLVCPETNIPSTTALATLDRESGRELGLVRGANIVMPNLTPFKYRACYEIYPAKSCIFELPGEFHQSLLRRIAAIGRVPGRGQGVSPRMHHRNTAQEKT